VSFSMDVTLLTIQRCTFRGNTAVVSVASANTVASGRGGAIDAGKAVAFVNASGFQNNSSASRPARPTAPPASQAVGCLPGRIMLGDDVKLVRTSR
jgi:hypothetical protein